MRCWLFALVVLTIIPGAARAAELARVPDGDAAPAADAGAAADDGGLLADFLASLFAERPAAPPPSRVEFVRSFTDRWGVPCREYVQHVVIGDGVVEASGTVCRGADGRWVMRE